MSDKISFNLDLNGCGEFKLNDKNIATHMTGFIVNCKSGYCPEINIDLVSEDGISGDEEVFCNAGVLAPGVYYWRVRAYDGKIYGSWSDTRIINVNAAGATSDGRTDKANGHKRF